MSLKDRLDRLNGDRAITRVIDGQQDRIDELRRRLDRAMNRWSSDGRAETPGVQRDITPLETLVDGEEVQTPHGRFFISRSTIGPDGVHGRARICDLSCAPMEPAAFLAGLQITAATSMRDCLFLDTETTGLMGGTGTFPFLIGLGWFEADSLVTCQLFARDFPEEGAMLRYLSELASNKKLLVTFNGKAYDVNLLATRFILNRCHDSLTAMPHIDLLHPSRRILAHRLEDSRLSTIETHILGVEREDDVPGFEIPRRYFDWLKRRDGRPLKDVFRHNRLDVISLASLLKHLIDLVGLVQDGREMARNHHGDLLRLAGLMNERGDPENARRVLEAVISSTHCDVAIGARQLLSVIHKKAHRWEEAAGLWESLVESNPCNFFAVQELAKFYEHHTRECGKALQLIRKLLDDARSLSYHERSSAEHRLRRLVQKTAPE